MTRTAKIANEVTTAITAMAAVERPDDFFVAPGELAGSWELPPVEEGEELLGRALLTIVFKALELLVFEALEVALLPGCD